MRGWARSLRASKGTSFLLLSDGTALPSLQCILDAGMLAALPDGGASLTAGCSVEVHGELVLTYKARAAMQKEIDAAAAVSSSPGAISAAAPAVSNPFDSFDTLLQSTCAAPMPQLPLVELQVRSFRVLGLCDPSKYPMHTKQAMSLEHLREFAHLRTRTSTLAAVMRVRHHAQRAVHDFFHQEGFFNVHTPVLTPLDCEGAGEVFSVTSSFDRAGAGSNEEAHFFGRPVFLTVSGQLYAEMLACSLTKVYTFGPTFRAEHSHTVRHLNEFWMVEPEWAHADLAATLALAERFVQGVVKTILRECDEDLRYFQARFNPNLLATLQETVAQPFARITYAEAIELLQQAAVAPSSVAATGSKGGKSKKDVSNNNNNAAVGAVKFEYPPSWEGGLQSEHERWLAEVHFRRPVFITHYPRAQKPFYMRVHDDDNGVAIQATGSSLPLSAGTAAAATAAVPVDRSTVCCFDLIVPGVGELIGGSEREERYEQLLQNMKQHNLDPALYKWYLDLRAFGTVPHASVLFCALCTAQMCTVSQPANA
jgi:asparaginyl-tRNA synthetase